jgi:hypothetical protein
MSTAPPNDAVRVVIVNFTADGGIVSGYPPKVSPILSDAEWDALSGLSGLTDQEDRDALDFLMYAYRLERTFELETPSPGKIRSDLAKLRSQVLKIAGKLPQDHKHWDALQGIARELNRIADGQPHAKPGPKSAALRRVLPALNFYLLNKTGKQITRSTKYRRGTNSLDFAIRFFKIADSPLSGSSLSDSTITNAIKEHLGGWPFLMFDHSERSR